MTSATSTFEGALAHLLDEHRDLTKEMLSFFSDMTPRQLKTLQADWANISEARRREFVGRLKRELEADTLLSFDLLARSLLEDADAFVRAGAIRLLSEYERGDIVPAFLAMAANDPAIETRAEAITALGAFILRGELDELSDEHLHNVEEVLIEIVNAEEKTELRQRALESLGYSSRPEAATLIREAWGRDVPMWKASAIFAMGRSYDQGWRDEVLQGLLHDNDMIRLAATKAAGELELGDARPILLRMLSDEKDEEVFRALIWSLSQIGGEDVREYMLSLLDQYEDEEEAAIAYIEEALTNLDFTEDLQDFDIMSYDEDDPLAE